MRIEVELQKPFRPIIVDADADVVNVFPRVSVACLIKSVESDAVVSVQLVTPDDVRILLAGVQANIKDRIGLEPVITVDLMTDP